MPTTDFREKIIFHEAVTIAKSVGLPTGAVDDDDISSNANKRIASSKLFHRLDVEYHQSDGSDVITQTDMLRTVRGKGTVLGVVIRPRVAPTGGDKQFTVQVEKAPDASNTWVALLTAVVVVDNTSVDDTIQNGALIATPTFAASDTLRVVIAASGSTGSQGQGVVVSIYFDEEPS